VETDRAVGAGQRVERGDVVDLLFGGAGLTAAREPSEAGTSGAHGPRGRGNGEPCDLLDDGLGVDADARERGASAVELGFVRCEPVGLELHDLIGCDAQRHG
jgi:hypothetical protein